ncbi:MAG: NfeD family protein [Syntrophothermus sp.]
MRKVLAATMRRVWAILMATLFLLPLLPGLDGPAGAPGAAAAVVAAAEQKAAGTEEKAAAIGEKVYVIPINGTIEPGLASYVKRVLRMAEKDAANGRRVAVLIEVGTFGGRVDAAVEIKDALLASKAPVFSFVKERAWSAGALITLAGEHIAMAPGSSIGAAEVRTADGKPVDEKYSSAFRTEFAATAESRGRDPQIAAAMVDKDIEIPGVVERGKLLTLTATKARELNFIDQVASSRGEVLRLYGYQNATVVETAMSPAERLARFLTDPAVSSILLAVGFIGLLIEVFVAGWGLPGTIGLIALGLFFGGRLIAGLAGLEVILLFLLGLALVFLEIFVIPGFGVAGVAGIAAVVASIYLSFSSSTEALTAILVASASTGIFGFFGFKYLKRTSAWDRLILNTRQERELGYVAPPEQADVVGKVGRALTILRPAGTVEIDGRRLDVVTEGEFIPSDSLVRVVKVEGSRVVVRRVEQA